MIHNSGLLPECPSWYVTFLPGGCTKYVQAPAVSWNKPFKAKVAENYNECLSVAGIHQLTDGGVTQNPPRKMTVEWHYPLLKRATFEGFELF